MSEAVHHDLNPKFKKTLLKMSKLCDGDYSRPINIEIWDHRKEKEDEYIGEVITTINQLNKKDQQVTLTLKSNVN